MPNRFCACPTGYHDGPCPAPTAARFEYMHLVYVTWDESGPDPLVARLNSLGADGWEACFKDFGGVFLKRRKG